VPSRRAPAYLEPCEVSPRLGDFCEAAALAARIKPDLLDEAPVALDTELDHDIHQQIEQLLDVGARQLLAPRLCLTSSTSCSKASSALAACTLVIEPGWPELTLRR
jgi:hypothetical protein